MVACLHLPSPVTAAAFGCTGQLGVATENGTLRMYEPPYNKVWKAVKTLGSEISSIVFGDSAESRLVWVACGQHVLCFSLDAHEMILERKDTTLEIKLTSENEDVLNEITTNGSHLAYSLDSGIVGVVDLKTRERMTMKTSHANLCTNVSFIPDRPRELISGGYDSALLHFDFHLGSLLSTLQIASSSEQSAQISLSPPFVLSVSVAETGLVACGLADGRIWLGSGGEKASREASSHPRQKKRRKWDGLRASDGNYFKIAEGPLIAIFPSPCRLFSLTLLGTLTLHEVEGGHIRRSIWTSESPGLAKANVLATHGSHVVIGGMDSGNRGIFIIRSLTDCEDSENSQLIEAN